MKTFAIATLGCKVNSYESESYIQGLLNLGYTEVDFKEFADVYIINTCAVTNTAAAKSRQKINAAKKLNEKAIVCVVGCYVQSDVNAQTLDVDILIGSTHKQELAFRIEQVYQSREQFIKIDDFRDIRVFEAVDVSTFQHKTRAFLKIQDGCNQFCAYCIIPYARGKERSMPLTDVIKQAKQFVAHGHQEIVLAGIHLGRYGLDIDTNLVSLLKELIKLDGLKRIRISSIEINEVDDTLIALIRDEVKIANHLHIPIQSGCDTILQAMRRPYTLTYFKQRIAYIRSQIQNISISTDIILGFPNESEEHFQETLQTLHEIKFSFMHVFPYSKRDGTKAAQMSGHLTSHVKKERVRTVSLLSKKQYNEYIQSFINKCVDVLFEYEKDGKYYGHTSEYIKVYTTNPVVVNEIQQVHICAQDDNELIGELL